MSGGAGSGERAVRRLELAGPLGVWRGGAGCGGAGRLEERARIVCLETSGTGGGGEVEGRPGAARVRERAERRQEVGGEEEEEKKGRVLHCSPLLLFFHLFIAADH